MGEWRSVVGYEGLYEVCSTGAVRGVDRYVPHGYSGTIFRPGRLMATGLNSIGYLRVNLCKDGKSTKIFVHKLVSRAFIGPIPDGLEVCHNDGNKLNCNKNNLRYDTHSANLLDRINHGTI